MPRDADFRKDIRDQQDAVRDAPTLGNPSTSEQALVDDLGELVEHSTRVRDRAAAVLDEAEAYNRRLQSLLDSYRRSDEVLEDVARD